MVTKFNDPYNIVGFCSKGKVDKVKLKIEETIKFREMNEDEQMKAAQKAKSKRSMIKNKITKKKKKGGVEMDKEEIREFILGFSDEETKQNLLHIASDNNQIQVLQTIVELCVLDFENTKRRVEKAIVSKRNQITKKKKKKKKAALEEEKKEENPIEFNEEEYEDFLRDHKTIMILLSQKDSRGRIPLHYAGVQATTDCTDFLLGLMLLTKINIDITDDNNETALCLAVRKKKVENAKKMILKGGSDPNLENNEEYSALDYSIEFNCRKAIEKTINSRSKIILSVHPNICSACELGDVNWIIEWLYMIEKGYIKNIEYEKKEKKN
eukprot:TRINITY_DN2558_c0_g3_i2.p1 TRINITY_DN2558_c0_g3~~TRINITY_DN2558_c0_g3_i2.p1  ORF type:complete len:325 (-),score=94.72 TRINITY_DN2558_c0_g3_i2:140-1114(-)